MPLQACLSNKTIFVRLLRVAVVATLFCLIFAAYRLMIASEGVLRCHTFVINQISITWKIKEYGSLQVLRKDLDLP